MFTFFSVQSNDGKDDERTWEENGYTEQEIMFFFFFKLFHYVLLQDIEYSFLMLYSRTLFIHSMCNSLHLTSTNSKFPIHPSPILPCPATTSQFSVSVSLLYGYIHLCHFKIIIYLLSGPYEASLHTRIVEVMEFQLSYFKS